MAYYDISLSWYNSDDSQEYIENVEVTKDPHEKIPIPIMENTIEKPIKNENILFFTNRTDNSSYKFKRF